MDVSIVSEDRADKAFTGMERIIKKSCLLPFLADSSKIDY
jgi:hypothetical protein